VINTIPTLTGAAFGVDFNPVPNALWIVSDAGQNLRIVAGGTGVVNTDGTLNPGTPSVVGAAYSNNFAGATVTTLYDLDQAVDQLFTQGSPNGSPISPNTGTLLAVGPRGVDITNSNVGFDISGATGVAFASLAPPFANFSLYTVNLATGAATLIGPIDGGSLVTRDISVNNAVSGVPLPGSLALLGMGAAALWRWPSGVSASGRARSPDRSSHLKTGPAGRRNEWRHRRAVVCHATSVAPRTRTSRGGLRPIPMSAAKRPRHPGTGSLTAGPSPVDSSRLLDTSAFLDMESSARARERARCRLPRETMPRATGCGWGRLPAILRADRRRG
jgi:Domain of unknown function (DUF4394)